MLTTFPTHLEDEIRADLADVEVRLADTKDADGLNRLTELEGRAAGGAPHLVAETEGELIASLSLVDGTALGDPFRLTAPVVDLLRAHAERFAKPGQRRTMRRRGRFAATAVLALALAAVAAGSANAAPKPGFLPGTWVGTGTITGSSTDGPMTVHFNGGISFTLKVAASRKASGTGTWRLDMLGSEDAYSDTAVDSTMQGQAAIALSGSSTNVTFSGMQKVSGEIRSAGVSRPLSFTRPLKGRLSITRAGKCRVTGGSTTSDGVTLRWSAVLKGSGTCRA